MIDNKMRRKIEKYTFFVDFEEVNQLDDEDVCTSGLPFVSGSLFGRFFFCIH